MINERIPKVVAVGLAWLAVACEKHMSGPLSSTEHDLEQVYRLHDPALAGHQRAEAVLIGTDGITVLASANPKGDTEHTWLLRLSDDGALTWERHYHPGYGTGRAITGLRNGGRAIAGDVRRGAMAYQGALLLVDATGAVTNAKSLGPKGVTGLYVVHAPSGPAISPMDAIVAGGTSQWKGWLVSTDSSLQRPSEAPVEVDEVNGLAVLPSGGLVAMGNIEKSTTGFGLTRLVAVSADRTPRWQIQLPTSGQGDPAALVLASNGDLLALGNGAATEGAPARIWLARVDTAGKLVWQHTIGDATGAATATATPRARAATALPDGGFAVAGETSTSVGQRAPHVWRLAADGAVQWQRSYGGSGGELATDLATTRDGGLVMVGSTARGPGKTNVWVVRLDPSGNVAWQRVFGDAASP